MGDIMKRDKFINVAIGRSRKELNYVNLNLPYLEFIDKYIKNTETTPKEVHKYLSQYESGVRCMFKDFTCTSPCIWGPRGALTRKV